MIRRILAAGALALGLLAVPVAADASGPTCNITKAHRQRTGTLNLYGNGYLNSCFRPHTGHAIRWVKPLSLAATYRVSHVNLHPRYWCSPIAGNLDRVVFRLYISNPVTGYNAHQYLSVDCDGDGNNSDVKGLSQMPRCYMPWIASGGRVDTGHRAWCRFRMTAELVNIGPMPNDHYTIGGGWIVP